MHKFSNTLIDLKSSVWSHGLIVPLKIISKFLKLNNKWVVCLLSEQEKIHVALMPKGENTWFINLNMQIHD
jgi:hypothetical protein